VTDGETPHVVRSSLRLWVGSLLAWMAGLLGLTELAYAVFGKSVSWQGNVFAFGILTAVAVFFGVMFMWPRLVVSEAGIHVINPIETTFVRWGDIETFVIGPTNVGPSLHVIGRNDLKVPAVAVQPARIWITRLLGKRSYADNVAANLIHLAEQRRGSTAVADPRAPHAGRDPARSSLLIYACLVVALLAIWLARS
jgi:hypothetical protein